MNKITASKKMTVAFSEAVYYNTVNKVEKDFTLRKVFS